MGACFFFASTKRQSAESSSPSTTTEQSDGRENPRSIADSCLHYDYVPVVVRSDEVTRAAREDAGAAAEYTEPEEWTLTRETIIETAYELYGVSEEWTMWLIGTTHNEQYYDDRYLEYAWACEILNEYADRSVWELDCIWGSYYSIENALDGFYAADDTTLEMVWYAMTDRDTRITEVDGMIVYPPDSYYLIYDSDIYNCQVWGDSE